MTPEQWQAIKDSLHAVLESGPEERNPRIEQLLAAHPDLQAEIQSLLSAHQQMKTDFLGVEPESPGENSEHSFIGRQLGPYRIIEQVGSGGMGEVFRAVRADDQFQKQVAIKLVSTGHSSGFVLRRFRNERQILATLEHPNIARLLDGGATTEGIPYLVMELVEGVPIDQYCDAHRLPITERLKLLLQVCSAVQYAHQRLIIHRDIKPNNILVSREGVPKLLDFGIAKILDPELMSQSYENTMTLFRLLTPGYASPEQVRGEPFTTASDVYSLGVVLYELLTGHSPYGSRKGTAEVIGQAVCGQDPEPPSTVIARPTGDADGKTPEEISALRDGSLQKLRKRLHGDLDNIALMTLRKETQRRYSSVEGFATDISRHLSDLPVMARGDSARYRASKFITRHKAPVSAGLVALIMLLAGLAVTLREARIARFERAKAEQRFNDVRKLANSLIFEIHDSIQNLQGATSSRKLLLDRALEYLDSLFRESAGDLSLQRELASGYERIGVLQGNTQEANLGDLKAASVSLEKAVALRESIAKATGDEGNDQLNLAVAHRQLARILQSARLPNAREHLESAIRVTARFSTPDVLRERIVDYEQLSELQDDEGEPEAAMDPLHRALAIAQQLLSSSPDDKQLQRLQAKLMVILGYELSQIGSRDEALRLGQAGVQALEQLAVHQIVTAENKRLTS